MGSSDRPSHLAGRAPLPAVAAPNAVPAGLPPLRVGHQKLPALTRKKRGKTVFEHDFGRARETNKSLEKNLGNKMRYWSEQ